MEAFWSVIICNYKFEMNAIMSSKDFLPRISEGEHLASMVLPEDLPRLLDFIRVLNQGNPTFGHEMSINDGNGVSYLMQVGGFPTDEGIYIVMYRNYLELYEELMRLNNEQASLLRLKMKAAFTTPPEYESLTSLNNELLNSQRELHKNKLVIEKLLMEKEQLNQSLSESNRLKNQLLGIIGHDLRTPLGHIISYLQLVSDFLNQERVDRELRQLSTGIVASSKQALKVLENLIIWSKGNESGIELQYSSFFLEEFIEKVIELEQLSLREKNIQLRMAGGGVASLIWSDSNILDIIIRNILANAIKYSPKNGVVEIDYDIVWDHLNQGTVVINIRDYGEGISENEMEKINRGHIGYSKRGTMGEKGSGLGLSITKQMAQLLGGTICFKGNEEGGTTVSVMFKTVKKADIAGEGLTGTPHHKSQLG